ncbi:unnamed protein product [Candidula unifasciata]|uniref:N-acetylglucosaminylphosphatidylinositol deacetylase n=1 Tax=Candidula unifasciata TaxID=100452 RepID=A0A8S3Z1I7_9EUPU|nr:unnamed protein product [Candidula unifasciata]
MSMFMTNLLWLLNYHTLSWILQYGVFLYVAVCSGLYIILTLKAIDLYKRNIFAGRKVLLVTAHPDDECMFFSPAILELSHSNSVHILCVTTGNYYGLGTERKKEILESAKVLGIPKQNVEVFDDSCFLDDPHQAWDVRKLQQSLMAHIEQLQPDYILTFDDKGVSGHPNHIAVSQVLRQMLKESRATGPKPRLYLLETVSLARQYISFLDLPLSLLTKKLTFVSSFSNIICSQRAMYAHQTQFVWFRILHVIFSRYMVINTFVPVEL